VVLFIKIIEANFRSMERDFEEREEGAKCLLLITNTSGEAQEWISRQSTKMQESWARLIGGLTTRFPKVAKVDPVSVYPPTTYPPQAEGKVPGGLFLMKCATLKEIYRPDLSPKWQIRW